MKYSCSKPNQGFIAGFVRNISSATDRVFCFAGLNRRDSWSSVITSQSTILESRVKSGVRGSLHTNTGFRWSSVFAPSVVISALYVEEPSNDHQGKRSTLYCWLSECNYRFKMRALLRMQRLLYFLSPLCEGSFHIYVQCSISIIPFNIVLSQRAMICMINERGVCISRVKSAQRSDCASY